MPAEDLPQVVGRISFFVNAGLRFITEEIETGEIYSKVIADKYICTVIEMTKVDAPGPGQAAK